MLVRGTVRFASLGAVRGFSCVSFQRQKQDGIPLADLEKQQRVQIMKRKLTQSEKLSLSKQDYLDIAAESGIDQAEATKLLNHLHESGVVLHYSNNPLYKDVVVIKPEQVTKSVASLLNVDILQKEIDKHTEELSAIEAKVAPLREVKRELDRKAKNRITAYLFGGLGYLLTQTFILAKMTWIDFGWDVVEPITYFFTFSVALIGYTYFLLVRREYSYDDVLQMMTDRRRRIEYKKNNFDYEAYAHLEREWRDKADQIKQECLWAYGVVPKDFQERMNRVRKQVAQSEIRPNEDLQAATRKPAEST
ncbi:calcium uniporter protein, mitochondrial [Acrasis kona]|uniref:Calcium uniporter protein, mitochondrial n=1 Tax=Acrasis kona TaxID=1008807 RepID=A0AAW2ZDQ4_9EUKA